MEVSLGKSNGEIGKYDAQSGKIKEAGQVVIAGWFLLG